MDIFNNQKVAVHSNGIFTAQVFGWMTLGVAVTAVVAFIVNILALQSYQFYVWASVAAVPIFFFQLILVLVLGFIGKKVSGLINIGLFVIFSITFGLTVGIVTLNYEVTSIFISFAVSSVMFLVLALYGYFTKRDLSRIGQFALFALAGIFIVSIINLVLSLFTSPLFSVTNLIFNYLIVIVFSVLIAYDAQKIRSYAAAAEQSNKYTQFAILAALELYLDFINLFLSVLRITGSRRR